MPHSKSVIIYEKGSDVQLGEFLNQSELDCKCSFQSCNNTLACPDALLSFNKTRDDFGSAIGINSGYRCQRHNSDPKIKGSKNSKHMRGEAHDIFPYNGDLDQLEIVARKHYHFVLRYPTFLHCDSYLRR